MICLNVPTETPHVKVEDDVDDSKTVSDLEAPNENSGPVEIDVPDNSRNSDPTPNDKDENNAENPKTVDNLVVPIENDMPDALDEIRIDVADDPGNN